MAKLVSTLRRGGTFFCRIESFFGEAKIDLLWSTSMYPMSLLFKGLRHGFGADFVGQVCFLGVTSGFHKLLSKQIHFMKI